MANHTVIYHEGKCLHVITDLHWSKFLIHIDYKYFLNVINEELLSANDPQLTKQVSEMLRLLSKVRQTKKTR